MSISGKKIGVKLCFFGESVELNKPLLAKRRVKLWLSAVYSVFREELELRVVGEFTKGNVNGAFAVIIPYSHKSDYVGQFYI